MFTAATCVRKKKGNILNVHQEELIHTFFKNLHMHFFKNELVSVLTQGSVHDTSLSKTLRITCTARSC